MGNLTTTPITPRTVVYGTHSHSFHEVYILFFFLVPFPVMTESPFSPWWHGNHPQNTPNLWGSYDNLPDIIYIYIYTIYIYISYIYHIYISYIYMIWHIWYILSRDSLFIFQAKDQMIPKLTHKNAPEIIGMFFYFFPHTSFVPWERQSILQVGLDLV